MAQAMEPNTTTPHEDPVVMSPTWFPIPETRFLVCEAFSPPRATRRALERGMRGGWALDLQSPDPVTQKTYDLGCLRTVARVKAMLKKDRPLMLIVSPPCTYFSSLMNFSQGPSKEDWDHAVALFSAAVDLCLYQARLGGKFILEHPTGSRAWGLPCLGKLLHVDGLGRADFHMCQYGMTQEDDYGCGFIYKPTSILTNSEAAAQ